MKSNLRWATFVPVMLCSTIVALGFTAIRYQGNVVTFNDGAIAMTVKLGNSKTLQDGSTYLSSVRAAIDEWNAVLNRVQLSGADGGEGSAGDRNGINEIAFANDVFGSSFGSNVLAVTVSYRSSTPRVDGSYQRTQADILFNTAYTWDSYRGTWQSGAAAKDLRRVALHELGHVLGLDHPDQANQSVSAIMNSTVSDTITLQTDDVNGAKSLYGPPTIELHPSDLTISAGSYGEFRTSAYGSSPLTYQWQVKVPGGVWTDTNWTVATYGKIFSLSDSGNRYRCVFKNPVATVATNEAVLTVIGVAPSVYYHPSNQTITFGYDASMSASFSGSSPISYRWQVMLLGGTAWSDLADGTYYAGTGSSTLSLKRPPTSFSGNAYRCVGTNAAGSAQSSAAFLTVNPAIAPSISVLSSVVLDYGGYLSFSPTIGGTGPMTYQWYRNGQAIADATSSYYSKSSVTTADAGSYSLTATNAAGSVSSNTATVTVNPAVAPSITQQPVSVSVAKGYSFSLGASASGTSPFFYQWYRDGVPLVGEVSAYYSVNGAAAVHSGTYYLKISNVAGTVTTNSVTVAVLSPARPTISGSGSTITINASSNYISIYPSVYGSQPISYQWFKDGVAIPGATSYSYSKSNATSADAGVYTLRATNEGGVGVSGDYTVVWSNAGNPWVDAVQLGNVVYFLFSAPARILRYDLAQEAWLPVVYLGETRAPTAFLPTAEGVFIAFDKELVRRSTDLASETAVLTSTQAIKSMWNIEASLYFADGSSLKRVNRSTLAVVSMSPPASYGLSYGGFTRTARPVYATSNRTLYSTRPGISPNDIEFYPVATDGSLTAEKDSPYHGDYPVGTRQYLSPDESLLIDNSGVVYNSGPLTFAKSLGRAFDDLGFLSSGATIVLRGSKLTVHATDSLLEQGSYTLGDAAYGVFCRGTNTYAFGGLTPGSGNPTVTKVPADVFTAAPPASSSPIAQLFSVDYVFGDDAGTVHILSRSARSLMRWDASARKFVAIATLRGSPSRWSYARSSNRLFIAYGDGLLTRFDLSSSMAEQPVVNFGAANSGSLALMGMDDTVLVQPSSYGSMVFSLDGALRYQQTSYSYYGVPSGWTRGSRRLYYTDSSSAYYLTVSNTGVIPTQAEASASGVTAPLRFNADGSLILAGGTKVVNAGLQTVATLPNTVTDGVWLGDFFYAIREKPAGTEVQKLARITYAQNSSAVVSGTPLAIFAAATDQVVVVTLVKGYVAVHLLDQNLGVLHSAVNDSSYAQLPTIVSPPGSVSAVAGDTVQFSVGAIGSPTLRYYWQVSPVGSTSWTDLTNGGIYSGVNTATLAVANVTTALNGNAYRCAIYNGSGFAISDWAGLSVSASGIAPSVSTQPVSAAVTIGADATFTVAASGSPTLRYFWQVAAPGSASWTDLTDNVTYRGTNTATLTVKGTTAGLSGGAYRCAIFNGYGYAISDWASLTVAAPAVAPSIIAHPANNTVNSGDTATFTVAASGTATLRYYWQVATPGSTSWTDLSNGGIYSGVNTATLTVAGAASGQNGNAYRCAIFNAAGYVISDWASLTVAAPAVAPSVTTPPSNATVSAGDIATFNVVAAGTTLRFYWQVATPGSTSWTDLTNGGNYSGVNTATLTISSVASGQSGNAYRCAIYNSAGYAISDWASLTVAAPAVAPSVTTHPSNRTVNSGGTTTFSVVAAGSALRYYWQVSRPGSTSWTDLTNGGIYSGVNTATLTVSGATSYFSGNAYRCAIFNSAGYAISNWASLTIAQVAPGINSHPSNVSIEQGANAIFTVTASGSDPLRYYWQVVEPGSTTWTDLTNGGIYSGVNTATLTITGAPFGLNGYAYRCAIYNDGGFAVSNWAGLTVTGGGGAPAITVQPSNTTQVVGSMARFEVTAGGSGVLRYYWQVSLPGTTTWTDLVDDLTYSGVNTPALWVNLNMSSSAASGAAYRCAIYNNFGYAISGWATLTIGAAMHEAATDSLGSYSSWAHTYFTADELLDPAVSGPDAVNGPAGLTNLLKYALGLDPGQDGSAALPETTSLGEHWFFTYRRPGAIGDIDYHVEVSTDLINWSATGVTQELILVEGTWQTWQAQYHAIDGQTVHFRLRPVWRE